MVLLYILGLYWRKKGWCQCDFHPSVSDCSVCLFFWTLLFIYLFVLLYQNAIGMISERVSFTHLVLPLVHFLWERITYLKIILSFFFCVFSFQKLTGWIIALLDWSCMSLIFSNLVFVPLCSCSVLNISSLFNFNSYFE